MMATAFLNANMFISTTKRLLLSTLFLLVISQLGYADDKIIAGWMEPILVHPTTSLVKAKLDSGAKTSSLHAIDVEYFKKEGGDWVRFQIDDEKGELEEIEKPVERWVRIKKKEGGYVRRPVVVLGFCLGSLYLEGEVNLADRAHFNYQALIGRNMLQGNVLIDCSKKKTLTPNCKSRK